MITLLVCPECGRVKKHQDWVKIETSFSDFVERVLRDGINELLLESQLCPHCIESLKPVG
ncbi:unnamed protein product [marine sediment metagenome]|uniref:Uncharacterized protein n=1 Tax=marine sediment metagenome TaxID=412755 RepID=X0X3J4_9ZZZZ